MTRVYQSADSLLEAANQLCINIERLTNQL